MTARWICSRSRPVFDTASGLLERGCYHVFADGKILVNPEDEGEKISALRKVEIVGTVYEHEFEDDVTRTKVRDVVTRADYDTLKAAGARAPVKKP